ncbi:AlwI family type II restriction endonuclease [Streptococcus parauberis]|uniref:AlwI restriction endonuclease n=1 Tax=Streptococcus parauberis NCFD 2020 TaxID=873447 RepID=F1YZF0_9STRE|nr:AlwI family type II restriction endonuclease [Streptococcus parauberis]EGE54358.1 AlwI restriction endonuclease [Streptococcus parauberis NCFD 2020]
MKLDSPNSIFNMGDTSIRVKQLVEVNKLILKHVFEYMSSGLIWERNTILQEEFYKSFIDEIVRLEKEEGIELFSDFRRAKNYKVNPTRLGLRGRTLTNALMKTGLISSDRKVSSVGQAYFNGDLKEADAIETVLNMSNDNLVYFRQFLKLRIYASDSDDYFYNFRFALQFLSKYDDVPQQDFLKIIESIKPGLSEEELQNIIRDYQGTYNNREIFDDYYQRLFAPTLRSQVELDLVKEMFSKDDLSDENFIKYFNNRDNNQTSLLYKEYVLYLLEFSKNHSDDILAKIIKLSKDDKIKKAFGEGKTPFKISRNTTVTEFLDDNVDNHLLSGDGYQIYLRFIFSKHNDLIREYSDMCRRAFQVTGLISFENGLANLNSKWIISPLIDLLGNKFTLTGSEPYTDYELTADSPWFSDLSTTEILDISSSEIDSIYQVLGEEFGITNLSQVNDVIVERRENEYRTFIETNFPIEKVVTILESIKERDDEKIFELVTETATVPTIYEYVLTIAWYYISKNKKFKVHQLFQVSLDGNKLPLTHRGGGAGDIEIVNEDYSLLIEATLMDMNTQKRGELEPVIRHSINFEIANRNSQTIFIANELDNNVLNIFRASQYVQFNGTFNSGTINGLRIFALTTDEVMQILIKRISDIELLSIIESHRSPKPQLVLNNWRDEIVKEVLKSR